MDVPPTYAVPCPMQPPVTFSSDNAAHPVFLIIFVLAGSCLVGSVCQGADFLMWEVEKDGGASLKAGVGLSPPWPPGIHISLCSDKVHSLRFAHSIRSAPLKGGGGGALSVLPCHALVVFAYVLLACKAVFLAGGCRSAPRVYFFACATALLPRPFVAVGITRIILTCNLRLQRPSVQVYFQPC